MRGRFCTMHSSLDGRVIWDQDGVLWAIPREIFRSNYRRTLSLLLRLRYGRQNANTTLSLQLPMKFGNIVWVETSRYLTKITTLQRKADRKSARSKVLAAKHRLRYNAYRSEIIFCPRGGEAGRAIDCSIASCRDELMKRGRGLQARGAYSRCQA